MIKIIYKNIKWWLLKRKILRGAKRTGCDFDGDFVYYQEWMWLVDILNGNVAKIRQIPYYTKKVERDYLKVVHNSQKNHSL